MNVRKKLERGPVAEMEKDPVFRYAGSCIFDPNGKACVTASSRAGGPSRGSGRTTARPTR
jgi:hypothetical protein